jgi:hypothetical protein
MAATSPGDTSATSSSAGHRGATAGRHGSARAHDARPTARSAEGQPDLDVFLAPAGRTTGHAAAPPSRPRGRRSTLRIRRCSRSSHPVHQSLRCRVTG